MVDRILQLHKNSFHKIVPFDQAIDKTVQLNLSETNNELTPRIFEDTLLFSRFINEWLQHAGARYGIGGYLENRKVYARSRVFDAGEMHNEPRTVHLGIDIWGPAGTPVMAPLDGTVHSKGNHTQFGNYGATIILQHYLDGCTFFTLYGHLSYSDLMIEAGEKVNRGEIFAHFGKPEENGHWPPHLHFQIIENLDGNEGDYPGVCAASDIEYYGGNCPNPEYMLKWD